MLRPTRVARARTAAARRPRQKVEVRPAAAKPISVKIKSPGFALENRDDFLRLQTPTQGHVDVHYFWLRHNCPCSPGCLHPKTRERVVDVTDIAPSIRPETLEIAPGAAGDELRIRWQGGHTSTLPVEWLMQHAYAKNQPPIPLPGSDPALLEVKWAERTPQAMLARLRTYGALVVRGAPATADDTFKIVHQEFSPNIVETHFGLVEDLRTDNTTNKNNDQLGYTNAAVDLHTDQPFIEKPPSMQLLHCIQTATKGGESVLADAMAAARYVRGIDHEAYHYLTKVPIKFHRKQKNFESITVKPIIATDANDEPIQVRFSYFTLAPLELPFNQIAPWYRAYRLFTETVRRKDYHYEVLLRPGDFVIYNNHRMLHARTAFEGSRWMRGIYMQEEDVYARLSNPPAR